MGNVVSETNEQLGKRVGLWRYISQFTTTFACLALLANELEARRKFSSQVFFGTAPAPFSAEDSLFLTIFTLREFPASTPSRHFSSKIPLRFLISFCLTVLHCFAFYFLFDSLFKSIFPSRPSAASNKPSLASSWTASHFGRRESRQRERRLARSQCLESWQDVSLK